MKKRKIARKRAMCFCDRLNTMSGMEDDAIPYRIVEKDDGLYVVYCNTTVVRHFPFGGREAKG